MIASETRQNSPETIPRMPNWTEPVIHPITGQRAPAYLHGVIVPMYTPATADGELDEGGIRAYTDWLIETGAISALFPRSGLGQMYEFRVDQVRRMIDIVTDQAAGRLPVTPGCAGEFHAERTGVEDPDLHIRQTIELVNHAQERGCIAAFLPTPYGLTRRPGIEQGRDLSERNDIVVEFYETISRETSLPIVVYQPPTGRRSYRLPGEAISRLVEIPSIVGMKYTTDRVGVFNEVAMAIEGRDFGFLAGNEAAFMQAFTLGACGVIGQGGTNSPEVLRAVYERMMSSDLDGAYRAALDTVRSVEATDGFSPAIAGLAYLKHKGIAVEPWSFNGGENIPAEALASIVHDLDALRDRYDDNRWWEILGG